MMICFMGMPSCGKSTTAKSLAQLMDARVFLEPEEYDWPELVQQRGTVGKFTALSWFRSARVPQLFEAQKISEGGEVAIVDCYFDKLLHLYLRAEPFQWLIPVNDPYFHVAAAMAEADFRFLPKADYIVFISCDRLTWETLLKRRNRRFDIEAGLSEQFEMQAYMEAACRLTVETIGGKLLLVDQVVSHADDTARRVLKLLQEC
jgi:deoxyadenosine/deoxycytidine kinase